MDKESEEHAMEYNPRKNALFEGVKMNNNNELCRLIYEEGADVNMAGDDGQTALFYAVQSSNENMVRALIDAGADVNRTDKDSQTAIFHAVQRLNPASVARESIDAGAEAYKPKDDGHTDSPEVIQQSNCNEGVVRALIEAGADVNKADKDDQTALFYAVQQSNNDRVVQALVHAGAAVNTIDKDGETALFHAVQQRDNERVVRALDAAGADVTLTDKEGKTALFYAVQQSNNENVVRILVNSCDDIFTFKDIYGRTALFYADWSYFISGTFVLEKGGRRWLQLRDTCDVDILTLLLEKHATSPMEQEFDAKKLKTHGVKGENIATAVLNMMFRKCVTYPAFLNSVAFHEFLRHLVHLYGESLDDDDFDKQKLQEVENAMKMLDEDPGKVLDILVELGAHPNSPDSDGNTALHHAVRLLFLGAAEEHVMRLCSQLVKLDAQFNTRNHQNQTPLLFCLSGDMSRLTEAELSSAIKTVFKVCSFLLKRGSSVEETSRSSEESVFHLIMKLFQAGLDLADKTTRKEFLQEMIKLLKLFQPAKLSKTNVVNKRDAHLNTPLHLWATLALNSPEDYRYDVIENCSFEGLLEIVFDHLLSCGAHAVLIARNENNSTPMHMCNTWSAVKILLKAGASLNDVDVAGETPLLVAAKKTAVSGTECERVYPDFPGNPKSFWKICIENEWAVGELGGSVLSILIQSETFILAKALVDVVCEMNYTRSEKVTTDFLNAICKDDSTRMNWKALLVQGILKSRKCLTTAVAPLQFCCENILQQAKSYSEAELHNIVHSEILKLLRRYGANSESCLAMAETCPPLKDLLTTQVDLDGALKIPWTSVSKTQERKLIKVASRQDSHEVGQFLLHNEHIGRGSFGHVFAGINKKDGREVAIKRIENLRMDRPQVQREIVHLTKLADCEQALRYLQFLDDVDGNFSYIVVELMEGNLDDYLTGSDHDASKGIELCQDVIRGMDFLQKKNILHRDLKPGNILYKVHPELCLKIADFGLSLHMDLSATTQYGTNAGTRCWIAPEVLKSKTDHCKSSDMFSCGLLLHYILSVKKHPFSPADCTGKGEYQIARETESNIVNGNMEGWDESLPPEATHLIRQILGNEVKQRPTAEQALDHPMFWSKNKKIDFLTAVGNQTEFEYPRAGRAICLTAVEADLEERFNTISPKGAWNDPGYVHLPAIYAEITRRRRYDVHSVVDLVRFIRNAYAHVSESIRRAVIRKMLLENFVVLECFPSLVMEVYEAVTTHGWDQTRREIKYSMQFPRSSHQVYSDSSLDKADTCLPQTVVLKRKPDDIHKFLIPWMRVSKKHEDKLVKVASQQENHVVGQFWLHNDYIGCGSFGYVFAGINVKDGREVAIKRIEKLRIDRQQDKREITSLAQLADCEQVLRYLQFLDDVNANFSYIVVELMEGNLDDYLTGSDHDASKAIELCQDVIRGMDFLQKKNILHRDLKPGNVLYKVDRKLCLKIADFGLSRCMDHTATTVYSTNAISRTWIAPEVLMGTRDDHSTSSDMFSCGLLLHYILSVKKHPFSPADCAGKGEYEVADETESNIVNGNVEGWDESLPLEATHLVRQILENEVKERPTAEQAQDHPMFWSKNKKIDFLTAVGNQTEFEYPRAGRAICLTAVEADLEARFRTISSKGAWNDPGYVHMPAIYAEMTRRRRYDVYSVVDLVRFIRNAYAHVSESTLPTAIREMLLDDFVVLKYFPSLVMVVYQAVITHGWDKTREEIKASINK